MIEPQTQTRDFWVSAFTLSDLDVEQIYNHFLEVGRPQTTSELTKTVMAYRVAEERNELRRRLAGRIVYQPNKRFNVGDELVFPALQFAYGTVTGIRPGHNPQYEQFNVITVDLSGKTREFAADLQTDHLLNQDNGMRTDPVVEVDVQQLYDRFGPAVEEKIAESLRLHPEFISLAGHWLVKSLMVSVSIGHLHLAEAVLEVNEGGPLPTDDIMKHLDLDSSADTSVQRFSLNDALLHDGRFDEVAPAGKVAWFLRRMEPESVQQPPERLRYTPIPYDRALLGPQLLALERELDDEWSNLESSGTAQPVVLCIIYPHLVTGTLPLSARTRPLFPLGKSPRLQIDFVDEHTGHRIPAWVVKEHRYIYGFKEWFETNNIPIGGFLTLKPAAEPGVVLLGYDRRRAQREWVRMATVADGHVKFDLQRRTISCGYDDLLIVGSDTITALDLLRRRIEMNQWSLATILAEIFPDLAKLIPQNAVHAKTLYSAVNMLRRVTPGPLFAELVRHPAFHPVGDHYWQFDSTRL
ncbi:MAG: hypothetical protein AB1791_15140 [Chloroflexota bacterium]